MKTENLVGSLLVLACTAVNLAVLGEVQSRDASWPAAAGVLGLGLALGQAAVVIAWVVWGSWNVLLRLMTGLVLLFGLSWVAGISETGRASIAGTWYGALLVYFALFAVPVTAVRLMKYRLSVAASEGATESSKLASWQFSIWSLLCAMTATGIIIAVLRFVDFPLRSLLGAAFFFLILALASSAVMLTAFLSARLWPALLVISTICPVTGFMLSLTDLPPSEQWLELIGLSLTHGLTILVLVVVLRAAGYRLEPPNRNAAVTV